jgi:hypothetical protein
MDESMDVPGTLRMSDIEPQEDQDAVDQDAVDIVGVPMAIDKMDIDEPNNDRADDDGGLADDAASSGSEERPEIQESGDSSESYVGESSSSESTASGLEEEEPPWKLGNKRKAKKKWGGRKTALQSLAADASQSVTAAVQLVNIASEDDLQSFPGSQDDSTKLSDVDDDMGNPTSKNWAGGEKGIADETIDRREYIFDVYQRNILTDNSIYL